MRIYQEILIYFFFPRSYAPFELRNFAKMNYTTESLSAQHL